MAKAKAPPSSRKAKKVPTPVPAPKTRQKRPKKNPSRSDRCGDACAGLSDAEEAFMAVSEEITTYLTEHEKDDPFVVPDTETIADWQERINDAEGKREDAKGTLDELKDEIDNWKDNMPESLQGGDKYSTLEQTSDTLESACGNLDENPPTLADTGTTRTDWEAVAEEVGHLAENCSDARNDAENAEFPGMFG